MCGSHWLSPRSGDRGAGAMAMVLLAWLVRPWRVLAAASAATQAAYMLLWPAVHESPRWLLVAGRKVRAPLPAPVQPRRHFGEGAAEHASLCAPTCCHMTCWDAPHSAVPALP